MADSTEVPPEYAAALLNFTKSLYFYFVLESLACGPQIFMVAQGYLVYRRGDTAMKSRRRPYVIISILMLFFSILQVVLDAYNIGLTIFRQSTLVQYEFEGAINPPWWSLVATIASGVIILMSEGVMLWRAWILWSWRWVMLLPILAFVGSSVSSALIIVITALPSSGISTPGKGKSISIAWLFLSACTSLMTTGLICLRLLDARRNAQKVFSGSSIPNQYTNSIAIVVESALPYAIFGILAACLQLASHIDKAQLAYSFCTSVLVVLAAFSPQLIIYRVAMGQSFSSTSEPMGSVSQPIAFNHSVAHSTSFRQIPEAVEMDGDRRLSSGEREAPIA